MFNTNKRLKYLEERMQTRVHKTDFDAFAKQVRQENTSLRERVLSLETRFDRLLSYMNLEEHTVPKATVLMSIGARSQV